MKRFLILFVCALFCLTLNAQDCWYFANDVYTDWSISETTDNDIIYHFNGDVSGDIILDETRAVMRLKKNAFDFHYDFGNDEWYTFIDFSLYDIDHKHIGCCPNVRVKVLNDTEDWYTIRMSKIELNSPDILKFIYNDSGFVKIKFGLKKKSKINPTTLMIPCLGNQI